METGREGTTLAALASEYWNAMMKDDPLAATALGDRRYDSLMPDITPQGMRKTEETCRDLLRRAAELEEERLSEVDRITKKALLTDIQGTLDYRSCELADWTVDPLRGPQVELLNVESFQPVRTPEEGAALASRWAAIGPFMAAHMANLKRGAAGGKVGVRAAVEKSIEELRDLLGKPDSEWAFMLPLSRPHPGWSDRQEAEFRESVTRAVKEHIHPAYSGYLRFLSEEVLPRARPDDRPGIMHVPGGHRSYAKLITVHTSLSLSPGDIHRTGLEEVSRINSEMEALGEKALGTRDRKEILNRLRTDRSLYFGTRDEVAEKAERALARARAAIPGWFGRLPRTECEVVRMEEHEEKHSTIAYYRQPAADGSRPGRYYINTSAPETRPRYEAEALAYHESIPGHHLQIAIAQELEGMPDFRRHGGVTAFIEGWGLYSERLADEMGLYTSDLDRMGILSYDGWRACRLVVDTGMHAMGWTRQQAIEFMMENTALARNNIVNEVDRYIVWPGQALAYKTGQLELLRLRREAKARLGNRFDIKRFHDAVLRNGALPLEALGQVMASY